MRLAGVVCLAAGVLATTVSSQDYPPAFPRTNATALFKSDSVMVWDVMWPPGQPTPLHRHAYDQVGTYYSAGGRVITDLNGTKREAMTQVGAISNTRRGTTHVEEGTTDPPLRAVFIELRGRGPSVTAPPGIKPMFPREGATERLDDERVTVWDYTWRMQETTSNWSERDAVWIWLTEGVIELRSGVTYRLTITPGRIRHVLANTYEEITAVSGNPRAIIFELK